MAFKPCNQLVFNTRTSKLGELGTFSPAVNERFQALWIVRIDHVYQSGVYPSPRLDRVQAAYDQIELHVILLVLVLYFSKVSAVALVVVVMNGPNVYLRSDVRTRNALHNKLGCDSRLWLTDIFWSCLSLSPTPRHATHTHLNKNWRFRLLISIVSMSITWIFLNPVKARFAKISQPKPPAPMTRILALFRRKSLTSIGR